MKKLWAVVLLVVVASVPGQSAQSLKPYSDPGRDVPTVGNRPDCPIESAIQGFPVCAHVYADTRAWPQCCQVCIAGSFVLLGDQDDCSSHP